MAKLYELTGQFLELLEMASDESIDQQIINDTLESVDFEFEQKADGYAKVLKTLEGTIEIIDREVKRLNERKNTVKNNMAGIRENLENAMIATGKRKFKTDLFNFNIQKNPASVVVDDESCVPEIYWIEQEPKLDKTYLRQYLKENKVPWAHLAQTESLRIK